MVTLVIITMNLHLGLKKKTKNKQEKHVIRPYEKDVRLRIYKLEF